MSKYRKLEQISGILGAAILLVLLLVLYCQASIGSDERFTGVLALHLIIQDQEGERLLVQGVAGWYKDYNDEKRNFRSVPDAKGWTFIRVKETEIADGKNNITISREGPYVKIEKIVLKGGALIAHRPESRVVMIHRKHGLNISLLRVTGVLNESGEFQQGDLTLERGSPEAAKYYVDKHNDSLANTLEKQLQLWGKEEQELIRRNTLSQEIKTMVQAGKCSEAVEKIIKECHDNPEFMDSMFQFDDCFLKAGRATEYVELALQQLLDKPKNVLLENNIRNAIDKHMVVERFKDVFDKLDDCEDLINSLNLVPEQLPGLVGKVARDDRIRICYEQTGRLDEYLELLQKAFAKDPNSQSLRNELIDEYVRREGYEKIVELVESGGEHHSRFLLSSTTFKIYVKAEKKERYFQLLEEAYENSSNNITLLQVLATRLGQDGQMEKALHAIERGVRKDAKFISKTHLFASFYVQSGKRDRFVELAERALQEQPGNFSLRATLINTLADVSHYERAVELIEEGNAKVPRFIAFSPNFREYYKRLNKLERYIILAERALQEAPSFFKYRMSVITAYADLGNYHAALTKIEEGCELDPSFIRHSSDFESYFMKEAQEKRYLNLMQKASEVH